MVKEDLQQWRNIDCSINRIETTRQLCGKNKVEFIVYTVYSCKFLTAQIFKCLKSKQT